MVEDSDEAFTSEDLYAASREGFVEVDCEQVVPLTEYPHTGDIKSQIAETMWETNYIGVVVEFPNKKVETVVFSVSEIFKLPASLRKELVNEIFSNGRIWIGEVDEVFDRKVFTQSNSILFGNSAVVPTVSALEEAIAFRDNGILSTPAEETQFISVIGSVLGFGVVLILSYLIFTLYYFLQYQSNFFLLFIVSMIILVWVMNGPLMDRFEAFAERFFNYTKRTAKASRIDSATIAESENSVDMEAVKEMLLNKTSRTVEAVITDCNENPDTTEILLETEFSEVITVTYETPPTPSTQYQLNQLVEEFGVGSVRQLEGEAALLKYENGESDIQVTPRKSVEKEKAKV